MQNLFIGLSLLILASCSNNAGLKSPPYKDSNCAIPEHPELEAIDSAAVETADNEMQKVWVLVLDTSQRYHALDAEMYLWSGSINWPVDTMEKTYSVKKKALVVSEKSEDEMYRGEYFPRRFGTASLSIEYLNTYTEKTSPQTFALVAGIYDSEKEAKEGLNQCIKVSPKSFVLPSVLYMGCMH